MVCWIKVRKISTTRRNSTVRIKLIAYKRHYTVSRTHTIIYRWQGYLGSNQDWRLQRPLCYHYTIPQLVLPTRIELVIHPYHGCVMPLNYRSVARLEGFEPPTLEVEALCSSPTELQAYLVLPLGLEPRSANYLLLRSISPLFCH